MKSIKLIFLFGFFVKSLIYLIFFLIHFTDFLWCRKSSYSEDCLSSIAFEKTRWRLKRLWCNIRYVGICKWSSVLACCCCLLLFFYFTFLYLMREWWNTNTVVHSIIPPTLERLTQEKTKVHKSFRIHVQNSLLLMLLCILFYKENLFIKRQLSLFFLQQSLSFVLASWWKC